MSVHQFMLGRELPCTVLDLLGVRPLPLPGATHDALVQSVEAGRSYPDVLFRLGLSHLGRQELGLAKKRLSRAVELKPDYAPARIALAAVCDLLAQHSESVDQIDAVLALPVKETESKSSPNPIVSRYTLLCAAGFAMERMGTPGTAAYRYEEALAADPTDLFAHHRLAAIYLAHNQLEESVAHHRAILDAEPQEGAVRTSLAHLLQLLGRHKEAVWEYEKALCLNPESWEIQMELADQFERMGNGDAAIDHLRRLAEQNPQFPDLHLRLANLHATGGDDDAATHEFTEALRVHPDYLDCHIAYARHELRMGRTEAAMKHFQFAVTINNQNIEAYAGLSVALHRLGKPDEAREMLDSATKIAGNSDVLIAQVGLLELQAEATADVEEAFNPNQKAPATGEREMQREWVEQQIARYEFILTDHPSWTDVRVRYGMLLKLVGRFGDAAEQFGQATKQNPGYVEAWVQLALARRSSGDAAGAIQALESAIQIRPEYADLHYRLGLIYCSEMEFDLAMERMEHAAELNGGNQDFQRNLWVVLQGMQLNGRLPTQRQSPRAQTPAHQKAA